MAKADNKENNAQLILALEELEKEKNISKEIILDALETSLVSACKEHFGTADNIKVNINRETGEVIVLAEREIVENVEDPVTQIDVNEAKLRFPKSELGEKVDIIVTPKNFGRIAAQKAKQVVVQKIREEERKVIYNEFKKKEKEVVTGIVQRYVGRNISVYLGKTDALLKESELVPTEHFKRTEKIKVYIVKVEDTNKGAVVTISRTHPDLVKRLFETEVTEVADGTVEIRGIAREAGSRTKISVYSENPDVDAVGACVGVNGLRVNHIVEELRGEKIDIVNWDPDPVILIENALSPAKVISVDVSEEDKSARVIVPDYQLSLAIGKEGQNARLAARLTGYKIDIKSETQAGLTPSENYEE